MQRLWSIFCCKIHKKGWSLISNIFMVPWIHPWRVFFSSDCKTDKQKRIFSSQRYSGSSRCKSDLLYRWNLLKCSLSHDWWICSSKGWMMWELGYFTRLLRVYSKKSYMVQHTGWREKRIHCRRSQISQTKNGVYRYCELYIWWLSSNSFSTQGSLSWSHPSKMSRAYTTTSEELYLK